MEGVKDCKAEDYVGWPVDASSPFHSFPQHPLYLFPVTNDLTDTHFLEPNTWFLHSSLQKLQEDSPFHSDDIPSLLIQSDEAPPPPAVPDSSDPLILSKDIFRESYQHHSTSQSFSAADIQVAYLAIQEDQFRSLLSSESLHSPSDYSHSRSLYRRRGNVSLDMGMSVVEEGTHHQPFIFTTSSKPDYQGRSPFPAPLYVPEKILTSSVTSTSFLEQGEEKYREPGSVIICKIAVFERKINGEMELKATWPLSGCFLSPKLQFSHFKSNTTVKSPSNPTDLPSIVSVLLTSKATERLLVNRVQWISCGFEHVAALTDAGDVYSWGYGASGVLGHGETSTVLFPRKVASVEDIVYIESGGYHTVAVDKHGMLYSWGRGDMCQLGLPYSQMSRDEYGYVVLTPTQVHLEMAVQGVACGEAHTLILTDAGEVLSCGWGAFGQLGRGPWDIQLAEEKGKVQGLPRVTKVACGLLFSVCLTDTGQVWTWGSGEAGQLGRGATCTQSSFPQSVTVLSSNIIDIVCGANHVLAVAGSREIYAWGSGISLNLPSFSPGSNIVCFVPQEVGRMETAWRFVAVDESTLALFSQVKKLQDLNLDAV